MPTIEEYYKDYWADPEHYNDPTVAERQRLLDPNLSGLAKNSLILDVGCGRGEFCDYFAKNGHRAEGIDIAANVIEFARTRYPACTFYSGEVEKIVAGREGQYDFVYSSEVIEHLFDVGSYLKAINKLLKPNGVFALTTPYHGRVKNLIIDLTKFHEHYHPLGQHIRFFDKRGIDLCFRRFGFEMTRFTGYGRPWPFWKSMFTVARKVKDASDVVPMD